MKINNYIDNIFSENGLIVELGGRYTQEQHIYAKNVADTLNNRLQASEKILGLMQADTGIGKSLGYLVPVALYICLNEEIGDKKIIISTFTRNLQKQLIEHDFPFVVSLMSKLGLDTGRLKIAFRMGKQAFFSTYRCECIAKAIIAENPRREDEMLSFLSLVKDICALGSGLWIDYIEEYGDLPSGIKVEDIDLKPTEKNANKSYINHLNNVKEANIVITNHHSCIMARNTGIDEFDIHAMIFDEAHKLQSICFDMFNHKLNFMEIKRTTRRIGEYQNLKKKSKACIEILDSIETEFQGRNYELNYVCQLNHEKLFNDSKIKIDAFVQKFRSLYNNFTRTLNNKDNLGSEEGILLDDGLMILNRLNEWRKENKEYTLSAIGVSPVRKELSIAHLNINAAKLFGYITKQITNRIVLTSATLTIGKDESFEHVTKLLGLHNVEHKIELSVSPRKYADMDFVLMSKSCPPPILGIDEFKVNFNEEWLKNTKLMLESAARSDGSLLVLTCSYTESKIIGQLIENLRPLVHESGTSLKEYTAEFKQGGKILITCAGWEGLNLRKNDNSQLIKNIVITRIPYAPPNPIIEFALKIYGKKVGGTLSELKKIQWVVMVHDVVSKLKQGFGRGTRGPNDSLTVWIADSRMPIGSKSEKGNMILKSSIPKRFMHKYEQAVIFNEEKIVESFYI